MEVTLPEQQKAILHRIISEITLNPSNTIKGRSIKDIKLVFDASEDTDYVLTYDMVQHIINKAKLLVRFFSVSRGKKVPYKIKRSRRQKVAGPI
jgi:hypothetical protein